LVSLLAEVAVALALAQLSALAAWDIAVVYVVYLV
jgi:hypothetical protein